jgi:hypothetical protein
MIAEKVSVGLDYYLQSTKYLRLGFSSTIFTEDTHAMGSTSEAVKDQPYSSLQTIE